MLTPNQLLNVRRIMKEQRARRIAAANKAADRLDARNMAAHEGMRRDGWNPSARVTVCGALESVQ